MTGPIIIAANLVTSTGFIPGDGDEDHISFCRDHPMQQARQHHQAHAPEASGSGKPFNHNGASA